MRCEACGNKTRFDVFETKTVRAFHHYTLGGDLQVEEEEVLDRRVEKVICRWCGARVPEAAATAEPSPATVANPSGTGSSDSALGGDRTTAGEDGKREA